MFRRRRRGWARRLRAVEVRPACYSKRAHIPAGPGWERPMRNAALALALFATLAAGPARGDNTDDEIARAHFATGLSYYDSDRFASAVKEFLESYRLSKRPELLYNIARSYEKLGDPGHAVVYYRKFL